MGWQIGEIQDWMAERVDTSGDCWMWLMATDRAGYGKAKYQGKDWRAHRLVWTMLVGDIPDGLVTDHLCRVKGCVNPDHIELVTNAENMRRQGPNPGLHQKLKTHCPQGHEYSEANTYNLPAGGRQCFTCKRKQARQWAQRKRDSTCP